MRLSTHDRGHPERLIRRFRAGRMQRFAEEMKVTPATRVLDVGGTPLNWSLCPVQPDLTLLNLPRAAGPSPAGLRLVFADGCRLPFPDLSFDVVFSNSVIEHIPSEEDRRRFADEVRRVGKSYWVQTPCRSFPVEPHLLTPFLHYLPRCWQQWLVRRATVWQWLERPSPDRRAYYLEHYLRDIRLLNEEQLASLFPEARILREKLLGLTKSLIAVFP